MNWTKWGQLIGINCLIGLGLILFIELTYGVLFPTSKGRMILCNYVLCSRNLEYETAFAGTIKYTRDEYGFRGRTKPVSDIDFLVMGGSTTDQRYVTDDETWENVLEVELRGRGLDVDIVNAGVDGQSTFGHLWNFQNWLPLVPELRADYLVFYIGINETLPRENNDVFDFQFVPRENGTKDWIKIKIKRSISYWVYTMARFSVLTGKARVGHSSDRLSHKIESPISALDLEVYQSEYVQKQLKERLARLIEQTKMAGMTPVFVTQKSARWVLKDGMPYGFYGQPEVNTETIEFGDTEFAFTLADFYYMEKLVADEIMRTCTAEKLQCFDGFEAFVIDRTNTYDLVHTNAKGSEELASKLAPFFENLAQQSRQGVNQESDDG